MPDHLTAEDAARLLFETTPGPWFTESDGIYNDTRSYMVTVIGDSDQDRRDAVLIAAAPALAAALAEHKDCVSRADLLRGYIPADVARAEWAAEVARLRELLDEAERIIGHQIPTVRSVRSSAVLAEGSDVPPCPSCGMHSRIWPLSRCVDPFHGPVPGAAEGSDVLPEGET